MLKGDVLAVMDRVLFRTWFIYSEMSTREECAFSHAH